MSAARSRLASLLVVALAGAGLALAAAPATAAPPSAPPPARFFGIAPQTTVSGRDAAYMRAAGIGVVRWPFVWAAIEPEADGRYRWGATDRLLETAARHNLAVLPYLTATPEWLAADSTRLPVATRRQRHAWAAFAAAAARRYGPGGGFWRAHGPDSDDPLPSVPIRSWQIWNEANFFYFARPISPRRYGRVLKLAGGAIKRVDPGARVILSGLFGRPRTHRRLGMPAPRFLAALYRSPRIERCFDGIALHPYATHADGLEDLTEAMRRVARRHGDADVPLYITEMGWGSQRGAEANGFERGPAGQALELRRAYGYLLAARRRLRLEGVSWFSWKDIAGSCDFCDSTGLFAAGEGLDPKPAWRAFVAITGGRDRAGGARRPGRPELLTRPLSSAPHRR